MTNVMLDPRFDYTSFAVTSIPYTLLTAAIVALGYWLPAVARKSRWRWIVGAAVAILMVSARAALWSSRTFATYMFSDLVTFFTIAYFASLLWRWWQNKKRSRPK